MKIHYNNVHNPKQCDICNYKTGKHTWQNIQNQSLNAVTVIRCSRASCHWKDTRGNIQQSPGINCRFCPAKIVRLRGLCDYPNMAFQWWGDDKTLFYGEIAAVLPCAFKRIITLPTELEYDSQNWRDSKRGNTPALPLYKWWQRWGSQLLCSLKLVDWDICKWSL